MLEICATWDQTYSRSTRFVAVPSLPARNRKPRLVCHPAGLVVSSSCQVPTHLAIPTMFANRWGFFYSLPIIPYVSRVPEPALEVRQAHHPNLIARPLASTSHMASPRAASGTGYSWVVVSVLLSGAAYMSACLFSLLLLWERVCASLLQSVAQAWGIDRS